MTTTASAVSIGKFDCLHRGHQRLISNIREQEEAGLCSTVVTIDSLGSRQQILTIKERKQLLSSMGVQKTESLWMTKELRQMQPEEFVREILVRRLHTKYLTAGSDFRFGYQRKGDGRLLMQLGKKYGFQVVLMEKEQEGGKDISSTWIRELLTEGDIRMVNRLLGYPYFVQGIVSQGNRLGRTIGVPTINVYPQGEKLVPPSGVYVTRAILKGRIYKGVTNVGYKPTIHEQKKQLGMETHLFDCAEELYGEPVRVYFLEFLRPEQQFGSLQELRGQLERDIQKSKQYFQQIL